MFEVGLKKRFVEQSHHSKGSSGVEEVKVKILNRLDLLLLHFYFLGLLENCFSEFLDLASGGISAFIHLIIIMLKFFVLLFRVI